MKRETAAVRLWRRALKAANGWLERTLGLRLVRTRKTWARKAGIVHGAVLPRATYSPWLSDAAFQEVAALAEGHTLVDRYRLHELFTLARQAAARGGVFLEVGVWKGGSSAVIQKAIVQAGRQADCPFFIADTFAGVVKAGGDQDTIYTGGEHADASVADVEALFRRAGLPLPTILSGIFPDDHPDAVDGPIAFLHSDVDVYQSTKDILDWALPRLASGAIIVFDDYGFSGCEGVTLYCQELAAARPDLLFVHNLNGHAVFFKA